MTGQKNGCVSDRFMISPIHGNLQADTVVVFQQIEIEEAMETNYGPVLRLFGVTRDGNSVLAHIHGFRPYFYVAAPPGFMNRDLEALRDAINVSRYGQGHSVVSQLTLQQVVPAATSPVVSCTIFNRKSLWGYRGDESVPFIKFTCADQKSLPKVKDKSFTVA